MNTLAKPYACHSCDKSFGRSFNLRRHIANIHGEGNSDDDNEENPVDEEENESGSERSEVGHSESEDDGSDEEISSDELEDNAVYLEWFDQAKEDTREMRLEKYEKYIVETWKAWKMSEPDKEPMKRSYRLLTEFFLTPTGHSWKTQCFLRRMKLTRISCGISKRKLREGWMHTKL